ncbi:hypothetical protein [Bacillus wiedmannii]|uniref:hypothetical protein n=1 Tax=Bacillus wiedmannii TaxID=1890302 RepID=UPI003D24802B
MNIIDNRSKVETAKLERGALIVTNLGKQYLIVRDSLNDTIRLVNLDTMATVYTYDQREFSVERMRRNFTIAEIIPASEVQLVIGGLQ